MNANEARPAMRGSLLCCAGPWRACRAVAIYQRAHGDVHAATGGALAALAALLSKRGNAVEAEHLLRHLGLIWNQVRPMGHVREVLALTSPIRCPTSALKHMHMPMLDALAASSILPSASAWLSLMLRGGCAVVPAALRPAPPAHAQRAACAG